MKKQIGMDINVGIGDHLFLRVFMDRVKDQYDRIAITHSRPGMAFWHNNDQKRWDFNLQLGRLVFSEPPYVLVPNARFPFYPNEKIVRELNNKPTRPDIKGLCVGKSLDIGKYIVLTTKVRHVHKNDFDQIKSKLTPALRRLSEKYVMVISGEREVQRTKEYDAECNRDIVYGLYDYFIEAIPSDRVLDLSIPALGVTCSTLLQLRQDCLIMKESEAVLTFGQGGNLWISLCSAKRTIGFRGDAEWILDLMTPAVEGLSFTKDVDQFIGFLETLFS